MEKDVERQIINYIKNLGGQTRKVSWIGRRGAPDRLILLPGRILWIELKRPGGRVTPAQRREHALLRWAGQEIYVIDNMEELEKALCSDRIKSK